MYYLEWEPLVIHICVYVRTSGQDKKHIYFKQQMFHMNMTADPTTPAWT